MKFLVLYFMLFSIVTVQSYEFKGFTLKFFYQVLSGDFSNLKRREKIEKNVLRNETSSYLGKYLISESLQSLTPVILRVTSRVANDF